MTTLDTLDGIIQQLQVHATTIGLTLAGLMIAIYAISIMLSPTSSVKSSMNRWEHLQVVLICVVVLVASLALVHFAQGLGLMLG